ncbi:hypothetical protein HY478_00300 [Candidatus Uhrbacteria bacterium]|nr:hypothetical protein [Candidatus Uhrbacteria bacterium]
MSRTLRTIVSVVLALVALFLAPAPSYWGQCNITEQKLHASDGGVGDQFGFASSLDGDQLAVGAQWDSDLGSKSGSVYLYEQSSGLWKQTVKLHASDGEWFDYFGSSVQLQGDCLFIAATNADSTVAVDSGAVYFFQKQGGVWKETQKLTASDGAVGDSFGSSISYHGNRLVVGAHEDIAGTVSFVGSVYVFELQGGVWIQTAKLVPNSSAPAGMFGYAVGLYDKTVVIGAPAGWYTPIVGSLSVFELQGDGTWLESAILAPSDGSPGNLFGRAVAFDGITIVAGSPWNNGKGAAYVFQKKAGIWTQIQKLTTSDGKVGDFFGNDIALDSKRMLIGDRDNAFSMGAAYLFMSVNDTWIEYKKFTASDGSSLDMYGISVDLDGSEALIGAYSDDDLGWQSGSAYTLSLASLCTQTNTLSVSSGGIQTFMLNAGFPHAFNSYLLLGSVSGMSPGLYIGGFTIPLNVDTYTFHTLISPNSPPLANSVGVLDSSGKATASFSLPAGSSPSLAGLTVHHAYVVLKLTPTLLELVHASNAVQLNLIP